MNRPSHLKIRRQTADTIMIEFIVRENSKEWTGTW